ncbi:DUF5979 domain-containing protein [Agromyces lapidis]|uniref:DUF5979 domain-containing protein n=1 Tax=Agromyces lapidis TaxID=279574 RepID=A0ABV5SNG4_9MICO|nr:DUF5979 domain-containing protein [Agromyces lapidis]
MLVAILLGVAANVLAVGVAANAAEGSPISIDDVAFVNSEFDDGSSQELTVRWSVPGEAVNPVSVTMDLPEGLTGHEDRFAMLDPDGEPAGECLVTSSKITCTVDPDYVEGHELEMSGEFTFRAQVWLENLETEEHVFDFGDVEAPATVHPNPSRCFEDCAFGGWNGWKSGSYHNLDDTITWWVILPTGPDGIPAGRHISVVDDLDESAFEIIGDPQVHEARSLAYDSLGRQQPVFRDKPAGEVTVSADRTRVDFTSVAGLGSAAPEGEQGISGSAYEVVWKVRVLDEGKAKTYKNTASYEIDGVDPGTLTGTATRYSGSGTVVGRNFGKFELTKELAGDTTLTPEFTVNYTASLDGEVTEQRTISLRAGESFMSDELFKGTTITLDEVVPVEPANVTWADPVFVLPDGTESERLELTFSSANGNLGKVTEIRLQNRATLDTGSLGARKAVVNDDGMRIPEDTTFTLGYRWAANLAKGIPAGSGSVQLPLGGERVEIGGLPVGAVVTFDEPGPATIPGASWQTPVIEPAQVTIGADTDDVEVSVMNTLVRDRGAFEIVKRLDGDGAGLVDDPTFTVKWSYPADVERGIYEGAEGTVEVTAGGDAALVEGLPAGAVVTLEEVLEEVEGGTWQEPVFSEKTFTVVKDNRITVDLDNELTLDSGYFSAVKVLDGTGAALVPETDTFTIRYAYDAGVGFQAGEGELAVSADGSVATSGPLPYGAVLRLSEAEPAPVVGGTWTGLGGFSPETVTIGDGTTVAVTVTNTISRDVGAFSLQKRVEGSGAHLAAPDDEYTFTYEYPAGPGFEALEPTELVVPGDGSAVTVDELPAGAVVTLRELAPGAVDGGTWTTPRFEASNTFVVTKDEQLDVVAVNTLELNSGAFSVRKDVVGSGAGELPADAQFTVHYEFPAGTGFAGGSGMLTVRADGEAVTSEPIPFGAVVTLTEAVPAEVDGASWTGAEFSEDTVVIGDGTVVEVTLTNTLELPAANQIASTGVEGLVPALAAGALAMLAGAVLFVVARRRRA